MLPDGFQVNGSLATIAASLKQSRSEEDVQMRIQGLALLAPLSVSLDFPDLTAFVVNPITLAGMSENWAAFGASLQRLSLSEVREAIENAAQRLMSQPVAVPTNEFEAEMQQLEYEAFLAAAGRKDPLAGIEARDRARRAEEAAVAARQEEAYQRFRNGE